MNLSHLNEAQQEAVINTDGPMMLLAGAGSGKTRTLVSKIQYLLDEKNISPFKLSLSQIKQLKRCAKESLENLNTI